MRVARVKIDIEETLSIVLGLDVALDDCERVDITVFGEYDQWQIVVSGKHHSQVTVYGSLVDDFGNDMQLFRTQLVELLAETFGDKVTTAAIVISCVQPDITLSLLRQESDGNVCPGMNVHVAVKPADPNTKAYF